MRKIAPICMIVCIVLALPSANAQEYIKSVGFSPNSLSRIRSVNSTSRTTCDSQLLLDLDLLPAGTYFVRITCDSFTATKKLIKQ